MTDETDAGTSPAKTEARKLVNSFHDRFFVNPAAEEEGTWVQMGNDFWIKVRRGTSAHSKAIRKKLEEPHQALLRAGPLPEDIQEDLLTRQMALSLVMDWKGEGGPRSESGSLLEATPANIEKVLRDYKEFRAEVLGVILDRSTFKNQVMEVQAGN